MYRIYRKIIATRSIYTFSELLVLCSRRTRVKWCNLPVPVDGPVQVVLGPVGGSQTVHWTHLKPSERNNIIQKLEQSSYVEIKRSGWPLQVVWLVSANQRALFQHLQHQLMDSYDIFILFGVLIFCQWLHFGVKKRFCCFRKSEKYEGSSFFLISEKEAEMIPVWSDLDKIWRIFKRISPFLLKGLI